MKDMADHIHDRSCLAANENNELCCLHLDNNREELMRAHTYTLRMNLRGNTRTLDVFTFSRRDAYALACADVSPVVPTSIEVVYEDVENLLDPYRED
jgi:hypothetical protein